ncbi:YoaK family protein [Segnochrobactrum spirostomi]|uniref:DUF1275 domain-containing protein n=1 Tax=Segnochrobactrum spirostomi TaxID=2608987 RepID=A0A6A7Y965_9HYPH|nr:YoaK family protein [Segnochrobactrum spirostomi]MQT14538.1 DUF1275 domain-containing protein [Segnochrobactrum spirostomi]
MTAHLKIGPNEAQHVRVADALRLLVRAERSAAADAWLGTALCFIAGASNAGGFLAVGQYTSHMSGIVSAMADNLAIGGVWLVVAGFSAFAAFAMGAGSSAILIHWGRRHHARQQYTLPLLVEAALLLGFGVLGAMRADIPNFALFGVPYLCFVMGLQNAIITKISQSRIRTTHVTGMVTDLGIELGKLAYWNRSGPGLPPVQADLKKLALLATLLSAFFIGGVTGALGFKYVGFITTVPLAAALFVLAGVPVLEDVIARRAVRALRERR